METQENVYEVIIKRKMGLGTKDVGVKEVLTFYFKDIGDLSFSERLVNYFQQGMGEHEKDFMIVSVKCLGSLMSI